MTSAMAAETRSIPLAASDLLAEHAAIRDAAAAICARTFRFAMIAGRGSSGHAGAHLRYLVETRLGLAVCEIAPSVFTAYAAPLDMRDALFIAISQSGQSPDMVMAVEAARSAGALTIAIVNDANSPLARAVAHPIPIAAGPEHSVAATKSVTNSLLAGTLLVALAAGDATLLAAATRLPERLAASLDLEWLAFAPTLAEARACFVVGRGYGLGVAREIALKLIEVVQLPALAFSAAEFRHGPQAAAGQNVPLLVLRQQDETAGDLDALSAEFNSRAGKVLVIGGPASGVGWIGDDNAACDTICMLPPAYLAIERMARSIALDPDKPPNLSKVTRTF